MIFNNAGYLVEIDITATILLLVFGMGYAYYIFRYPLKPKYTYLSVVIGCLPIGLWISWINVSLLLRLGVVDWALLTKTIFVPWFGLGIAGIPMIILQRIKWEIMKKKYNQIKGAERKSPTLPKAGRHQHMS